MVEVIFLVALLSGVGLVLWRYENSSPVCLEEGQILEKRTVPYIPPAYPPGPGPRLYSPSGPEGEEHFFLRIRLEELGDVKVEVGQRVFEEAKDGMLVVVMYQKGRLSGRLKIIDLL